MTNFEYKVLPAPKKGLRGKGVKGTEGKFANALTILMNTQAADGWEYQRSDTLPLEERSGLTGKTTTYMNMLVFRRAVIAEVAEETETPILAIAAAAPLVEEIVEEPALEQEPTHAPMLDQIDALDLDNAPSLGPVGNKPENT